MTGKILLPVIGTLLFSTWNGYAQKANALRPNIIFIMCG